MNAARLARTPRWAALIAGLASATGFAPLGAWPVTLIALAVLMHLVAGAATARRAFLLGWLFGLGHFTLSLHWIATAFTFQAAMPPILGWVAVPLIALYLALYPALACAAAWWVFSLPLPFRGEGRGEGAFSTDAAYRAPPSQPSPLKGRGPSAAFTLLFAAAWIVTEWLRSWLFTGFAWNPLSAIAPWAAHPATLIGSYGQSGLVVLAAGVLLLMVRREWRWAAGLSLAITVTCSSAWLTVAGDSVVAHINQKAPGAHLTAITIVQPNIGQGDKWDLTQRNANFRRLAALSRPQNPVTPRLLLWPEAAVPDYLEDATPADWAIEEPAAVRARLAALLGPDDLLLTGAVRLEANRNRTDIAGARNAVFTLNARGQLGPRYDKAHLVPYGEYLPMRSILEPLGLSRLAPGAVDFWPGQGPRSIDLGRFGKVGIQICYEIIFSGQVVDRNNRPAFIFNPSNDAWFGSWGPPQHLAQARLRAIEEGLPVVRATPTGISAIIDADGRIVEALPMHVAGRIDARLPPPHAPTLFARHGNALPLAFAVFLGLLGVAFGRARR
ncbi:MAG: apolipoprotein N-acyltransferase [Sphingopyxis sp.]